MMGIGPEEAGRMDLWTYGAMMHNWNLTHDPERPTQMTPEKRKRLERAMAVH